MIQFIKLLSILILVIHNAYAQSIQNGNTSNSINGRWQLTINGQDRIEFGTEQLAGGLNIAWQTWIEFTLENGLFVQGTGKAALKPDINTFSRPDDMFSCEQVTGTFVSSSGISFNTPHLRYQAFPVRGQMQGNSVVLNPYFEYPGNYYAVLYDCETDNTLGSFWLERSPRIARELGKRQNALLKTEDGVYSASVKEVKNIPPGPEMAFQLIDGNRFSLTQQSGLRTLHYSLEKIAEN